MAETLGFDLGRFTATRGTPWHPHPADIPPADRDIPNSKGHNGSRASKTDLGQCPRVGSIEPRGPSKRPCRGNHGVPGLGRRPALPSGIHAAGVPIAVRGFRHPSSPVIMAYVSPDVRSFADLYGKLRLIHRQNRFFRVSGFGLLSRVAISSHAYPSRNILKVSRISSRWSFSSRRSISSTNRLRS